MKDGLIGTTSPFGLEDDVPVTSSIDVSPLAADSQTDVPIGQLPKTDTGTYAENVLWSQMTGR